MNKIKTFVIIICVFVSLFFFMNKADAVMVKEQVTGTHNYDYAHQVLDKVNEERNKEGLEPLVLDNYLTEKAMIRAAELYDNFSHTRPNTGEYYTILNGESYEEVAENIAYNQTSPTKVMSSWMSDDEHRENILNSKYKAIGIGHMKIDGHDYWVQIFTDKAKSEFTKTGTKKTTITFDRNFGYYDSIDFSYSLVTKEGEDIHLNGKTSISIFKDNKAISVNGAAKIEVPINEISFNSSNDHIASIDSNGVITSKLNGETTIDVLYDGTYYSYRVYVDGIDDTREVISDFEVNSATLDFEDGDKIKFTGKTNNKYYDVVEKWEVDISTTAIEYSDGRMDSKGRVGKFEGGNSYWYTVILELKDEYKDKYKLAAGDSASVLLNGKKYDVVWYSGDEGNSIELINIITLDVEKKSTEEPSEDPVVEPVEDPTEDPVVEPVEEPTEDPVVEPVEEPTEDPVVEPVEEPTEDPVVEPVEEPTEDPVVEPVEEPTEDPVVEPVEEPTEDPVVEPVEEPTEDPVVEPVEEPTEDPVEEPIKDPIEDNKCDAVVDATDIINPNTSDGIIKYFVISILSLMLLTITGLRVRKNN